MKQYRVSFPGTREIPPFTVWAHSYHRNGDGDIQFWNEGHDGHRMDPVLRLSVNSPAKIEEVDNEHADDEDT